jgi:hypothetical protein
MARKPSTRSRHTQKNAPIQDSVLESQKENAPPVGDSAVHEAAAERNAEEDSMNVEAPILENEREQVRPDTRLFRPC